MTTKPTPPITVFEHEIVRYDHGQKKITRDQFEALERFHGSGVPYFKLVYKGVQFNEYVGVIQVGDTVIEVLPKADKHDANEKLWRERLIGMLKAVGQFDVKSPGSGHLKIKSNSILDLYFELFVNEVEYLLHTGLVKRYRQREGNVTALKGSLQFGKHLQQNLIHHERFYVRHTHYDVHHQLNAILYKAVKLLSRINRNSDLQSRIGALMLNFPEMQDLKVYESTFEKIIYTRKNQHYQNAISIARMLLLQFHPDLSKGRNDVLALMFDMNVLWEKFVLASLRKYNPDKATIADQTSKYFWKPDKGNRSSIKPDIYITKDTMKIVLDTKWKNLNGRNPSPEDLRQMYVYHEYYGAGKVALVYPGAEDTINGGQYIKYSDGFDKYCSVITIAPAATISEWQQHIARQISKFIKLAKSGVKSDS